MREQAFHVFVTVAFVCGLLLALSHHKRTDICLRPAQRSGPPANDPGPKFLDEETDRYLDSVLLEYSRTKHARNSLLISNHPSTEGFGSRMTGLLSAFYLSLALNFSMAVHWSLRPRLVENKMAYMIRLSEVFDTNHTLVPLETESYSPNRTIFFGYAGARRAKQLARSMDYWGCSDFITDLQNAGMIKFTTTVWMLPLIRRNAAVGHYPFIQRTRFYKGLYRKLAAFLFRPSRNVATQARQIVAVWQLRSGTSDDVQQVSFLPTLRGAKCRTTMDSTWAEHFIRHPMWSGISFGRPHF